MRWKYKNKWKTDGMLWLVLLFNMYWFQYYNEVVFNNNNRNISIWWGNGAAILRAINCTACIIEWQIAWISKLNFLEVDMVMMMMMWTTSTHTHHHHQCLSPWGMWMNSFSSIFPFKIGFFFFFFNMFFFWYNQRYLGYASNLKKAIQKNLVNEAA